MAAKATKEQKESYLTPIAAGKHLTTLSLSEPGSGANFYIPETRLERRGDEFVIDGEKSFVTNGGHADSYVISATDDASSPGEFSCLVLPADTPGLCWGPAWSGWGMRGNAARSLVMRGARLPVRQLLGQEGDEIWFVFNVIAPYFITAMAGTYLGIATAALNEARRSLLGRVYSHTGAALAGNTVLQHKLGELWAWVERTRALLYSAAMKGDAGAEDALLALCSAKAEVAECAERVSAEVMTLLGGRGYAEDTPVHRYYRDARAAPVMAPTTETLRVWTGRAFLGLPLLAE
jgi:alkylation response protein AidB-like acyl-CoA dehydrogenase